MWLINPELTYLELVWVVLKYKQQKTPGIS